MRLYAGNSKNDFQNAPNKQDKSTTHAVAVRHSRWPGLLRIFAQQHWQASCSFPDLSLQHCGLPRGERGYDQRRESRGLLFLAARRKSIASAHSRVPVSLGRSRRLRLTAVRNTGEHQTSFPPGRCSARSHRRSSRNGHDQVLGNGRDERGNTFNLHAGRNCFADIAPARIAAYDTSPCILTAGG